MVAALHTAPAGTPWPSHLRATASLAEDAQLRLTTGAEPHLFLHLHLQPAHGLPYLADVDLGTDLADHMEAQALQPRMRAGATVSVAAKALALRTDHCHAALRMVEPHTVLLLPQAPQNPIPHPPTEAA